MGSLGFFLKLIGSTQISRFLAWLGDLALSFIIYHLLLASPFWAQGLLRFGGLLKEQDFLLSLYLFFFLFRFYCYLLLGTTPFSFLLGLRNKSEVWWKHRLLSCLKALLDSLTYPLLFLHWTRLWSSPESTIESTLPERLLGLGYEQKSEGPLQSLISFLIFPFCFLALYAPLLTRMTFFDGVVLSHETVELHRPTHFKEQQLFVSKRMGWQLLSDLGERRFMLWPDYQFIRQSNQLRLHPAMAIFDRDKELFIQLIPRDELQLDKLIKSAQVGQPLFSKRFKALDAFIHGQEKNRPDSPVCHEMVELIQSSFELGGTRLISHTLRSGPFIKGFVNVREKLMSAVGFSAQLEVDLVKIGKMPLLRMRQNFDEKSGRDRSVVHTYLPLCSERTVMFSFAYDPTINHALTYQDFLNQVFSTAAWEQLDEISLPYSPGLFNAFHISDYLTQLQATEVEAYRAGSLFFLTQSLELLAQKNQTHYFEPLMNRLVDVTRLVHSRDQGLLGEAYLQQILGLFSSHSTKDRQ